MTASQCASNARTVRPHVHADSTSARPARPEGAAAPAAPEQRDNGVRKRIGIVGQDDVSTGRDAKAFGADCRGDHGFGHGEGFENLQARAATGPERHNIKRSLVDIRANVTGTVRRSPPAARARRGADEDRGRRR